ncbi:transcription antitermination protein [Halogeometricum borinquense]|uniref:Transcription antitermination protein n=1 Tax=Halogeometricum borinquense TaxID=60847 RepID=A0A6C0ULL6_9EURY|nr:transcription antitermination protein [Halogeometricum borinquense]QIB76332.1 transcription antitermination protein [Halogeometricum borinquense]QIQ75232.1 transcription antitermination protein [Halogeometricum borinquense]
MNGDDLVDRIRDDHETAFSRLGSSKALYALTGGEMEADAVRAAAADDQHAAADVLEDWAMVEHGDAAVLLADLADEMRDHAEAAEPDEYDRGDDPALYDRLAFEDDTPGRIGGLLGRYLVVSEYAGQMVGFFVGDADPTTASEFRTLRSAIEDERDRVVETLAEVCESDDDWDAAHEAADAVVEAAYDDYVETLESMGVKPKNVC